jgi:hypothetical protein
MKIQTILQIIDRHIESKTYVKEQEALQLLRDDIEELNQETFEEKEERLSNELDKEVSGISQSL